MSHFETVKFVMIDWKTILKDESSKDSTDTSKMTSFEQDNQYHDHQHFIYQ